MSATDDNLREYHHKRDPERSPEPRADADTGWAADHKNPVFVIQRHDASSEHYDLRLEAEGVLKSWAVPKGPSLDPSDKRLAIRTEDHPLAYADFEGVIPEDEYGGGTVMIWDRGVYKNLKQPDQQDNEPPSVAQQIRDGHVTVELRGRKIAGGYALIRSGNRDDREQWLLVKMDDDHADARRNPVSTQTDSAASGRSIKQIAEQEEPTSFESGDHKE